MQWLMLQMSSVGPAFGNGTHFNRAAPAEGSYARRRFITQAVRLCALYDERLRNSRFLAGEELTIADIATFPWLWRHPTMLGINANAYPGIQRWVGEIRARPGFHAVHGRYKQLVEDDTVDAAAADPDMTDRFLGRGRWFLCN